MKNGNSAVVRVYLMLYCPIGTATEKKLKNFSMNLYGIDNSLLEQNNFQGKGSSFTPPFFALEVGFKQEIYDYDQLISSLNDLFYFISKNMISIKEIVRLEGMKTIFAINFNCQSADQKPAFDLNNEQLKILNQIGASLSLDSYLAF